MPSLEAEQARRHGFLSGVLRTTDLVNSGRLPAKGLDEWVENVINWADDSPSTDPVVPTLLPSPVGG